jgi:hypothetical protein
MLNNKSVVTLGCCCGHGEAGQIKEWENGFGKWKSYGDPPTTLIHINSVEKAKQLGYRPVPYYYADGVYDSVWQMQLKTGCITKYDCKEFHIKYGLTFEKELGVIE